MLNRERGEMRIGNEVRYRIGVVEQPSKNSSMTICRQRNPDRWNRQPLFDLKPCSSDAKRAIEGLRIGSYSDEREDGRPRQTDSIPAIQLIFQPATRLLMLRIIFDFGVEQKVGIN